MTTTTTTATAAAAAAVPLPLPPAPSAYLSKRQESRGVAAPPRPARRRPLELDRAEYHRQPPRGKRGGRKEGRNDWLLGGTEIFLNL